MCAANVMETYCTVTVSVIQWMHRCLRQVIITLFLKEIKQLLAETRVYAKKETYLLLPDTGTSPKTPFISTNPNLNSSRSHAALHDIPHGLMVRLYKMLCVPTSHRINRHKKLTHHHSHQCLVSHITKKPKPDKAFNDGTILVAQKTLILALEHLSLSKLMFLEMYLLMLVLNPIEHTPMYAQPHKEKFI